MVGEQGVLAGGGADGQSPGLAGHTVCATLIAVGTPVSSSVLAAVGEIAVPAGAVLGATHMKALVVVRSLCGGATARRRADHAGLAAGAAPLYAGARRQSARI